MCELELMRNLTSFLSVDTIIMPFLTFYQICHVANCLLSAKGEVITTCYHSLTERKYISQGSPQKQNLETERETESIYIQPTTTYI